MKKIISSILIVIILFLIPINAYVIWAYAFVVYNKNVYVITDKKVNSELIDSEIGHVTKYSSHEGTYSGNFSNVYPKGTKYYKIKGTDVNELIAIKEKDGSFTEAKYEHEYAGARYDNQTLLYLIGLIVSVIFILWLVKKKIVKS